MRKKIVCGLLLCLLLAGTACGRANTMDPEGESIAAEMPEPAATNYFETVWGWECPEGPFVYHINGIYHTESGTAGSSGKTALSALHLLELSNIIAEDNKEALAPIFASMNDAQARFFAGQWIKLRALADEALADPKGFREEYEWAGLENFDATRYSAKKLKYLDGVIASFLPREEMQ